MITLLLKMIYVVNIVIKNTMKSFLKWSGGKTRIQDEIISKFPTDMDFYVETFLGGGTILFKLKPKNAFICDINCNLINCYIIIRDNLNQLIVVLGELSCKYKSIDNEEEQKKYYYSIRTKYNNIKYYKKDIDSKNENDRILCCAYFLFLNKTCFNGLYRENKKGGYNVPIGRYKNPTILNESLLKEVSCYLNNHNIVIKCCNYQEAYKYTESIKPFYKKIVVYNDPPYYVSDSSKFVSYTCDIFDSNTHKELRDIIEKYKDKMCIYISNSNCKEVVELYKEYFLQEIEVMRSISSKKTSRGKISELLISSK